MKPEAFPETRRAVGDRASRLLSALREHPLATEVTPRRLERIAHVASSRLTSVSVVLENLFDRHNASAVARSAEGFGMAAMHVVEQPHRWSPSRAVTRGADRWMDIVRHDRLTPCLGQLSAQGFAVFAADVGPGCFSLSDVPVDRHVALVFGSEHDGISKRALSLCDGRFTVPMHGFVESFNVSVSAAVALHDVSRRRRQHIASDGDLSSDDAFLLALRFLRQSVKNEDLIRRREAEYAARQQFVSASEH